MADEKPTYSILPAITLENLVIEVHTLAIKGKKVKSALIRQFVYENLIDVQGPSLRGIPLTWHTLHDKQCADLPSHRHILWRKGNVYRIALVLDSWEQDKQYKQRMERLKQRAGDLDDLLALVLAQEQRYEIDFLNDDEPQTLQIGEYTLSVSPNVCYHLQELEEARLQRDQDRAALPLENGKKAIQQAQTVRIQLLDQGIILGHPTLDAGFDDPTLCPPSAEGFSSDYDDNLTESLASFAGEGGKKQPSHLSQILWEWKKGHRGNTTPTNLDALLRDNEQGLLVVISDLIVQNRLRELQRVAESLAQTLHIELSDTEVQKQLEGSIIGLALSLERIWDLSQETDRQCEEYPQNWDRLYQQLGNLEQVFIDG